MAAYRVLENMPNFNHNNPFVITCSERRRAVNDALFETTKRALRSSFTALLLFAFTIFSCQVSGMPILIAIWAQFGLFIVLLGIDWIQYFRNCLRTSIYNEVDELLQTQSSEILNINIEQVFDAEKTLCVIHGTITAYKKTFDARSLQAILMAFEFVILNALTLSI